MIFVTVGTQKFPFDRLAEALDKQIAAGLIQEEVVAQIGFTSYQPQHYRAVRIMPPDEADAHLAGCRTVIAHGGTSTIIRAVKMGKKVLVVPRQRRFGEHVDDHQLEIARLFEEKRMVECAYDTDDIPEKLERLRQGTYAACDFDNRALLRSVAADLRRLLA